MTYSYTYDHIQNFDKKNGKPRRGRKKWSFVLMFSGKKAA